MLPTPNPSWTWARGEIHLNASCTLALAGQSHPADQLAAPGKQEAPTLLKPQYSAQKGELETSWLVHRLTLKSVCSLELGENTHFSRLSWEVGWIRP